MEAAGKTSQDSHMPALTGIRFFAVLHIFLFHMYAWYWESRNEETPLLPGLGEMPDLFIKFGVNGWVSTSFFFLLSGFILAYIYWDSDGKLVVSNKQFWLMRAARIYPALWIVILITVPITLPYSLGQGVQLSDLIASTFATALLIQAWVPAWLPHIHWPAWTISALMFLYLIMPLLIKLLSRLSRQQMVILLAAMPIISLLPTMAYHLRMVLGGEWNMQVDMLVANNPLVWVPYFTAGLLLSRVFAISRFRPIQKKPSWFSWGDMAFLAVITIAMSSFFDQPYKFYLRQGLLMPFYMIIILDLARGRGFLSKVFSLPGTGFLGETSFSIFIWQTVLLLFFYISILALPQIGPYQHWLGFGVIIILAIISTYLIEKPIARAARRKLMEKTAG